MSDEQDEWDDEANGGSVGEVATGASGALEGIAGALGEGEDTEDAREGLETAAQGAETVAKGAETVESAGKAIEGFQSGNIGNGALGLGNALGSAGAGIGGLSQAIGGLVPEGEVRRGFQDAARIANSVGQVARGVGQIVDGAIDLIEDLTNQRQEVQFHLTIAGDETEWHVRSLHYDDSIGRLTETTIEARCTLDHAVDEEELLGKDVHLSIERGNEHRSFRGIIRHAHVVPLSQEQHLRIDVTPALWLLSQGLDSRIYQDVSVPDLVEQVVSELLGARQRTVRKDLTETYEPHEYLVQHRESHYEFIARLCDEEGIFFYFDHDEGEHEVLVLADSNDNRPRIRESNNGRVDFDPHETRTAGREVAFGVHRARHVGPTDAAVRSYDWTNPSLSVEHNRTGRGNWNGPPLEVYDHHHSVRFHQYDDSGRQYQSHTADRRSRLHTERLDIVRQSWTVHTTVVTAKPGHIFELVGTDDHDGRYLIISVNGSGTTGEHGGEIENSLQVIPVTLPYRPPAPARRMMPGPETAVVTGPPGQEIHTDPHGRVKVQFHWDRRGQLDEHSSAWIRVSQGWAGPGWGMIFIPRIGMEVVVSFLGGDPDRPVITGCLYNGQNTPPYPLPDDKTKSTIKTNSSLGGGGYNELRFEDKKGKEEVWIHAQKDFNEVVEHNHSTHVKHDQTNTVNHDQTETIHHRQTLTVDNDRKKTVKGNETTEIGPDGGNRTETVHGNESVIVMQNRDHFVTKADTLSVLEGNRTIAVNKGKDLEAFHGGREVDVSVYDTLRVNGGANRNVQVSGQYNIKVDGHFAVAQGEGHAEKIILNNEGWWESPNQIKLLVAGKTSMLKMNNGGKIEIGCDTEIILHVQKTSYIKLSSSGIEISGPAIKINATSGTTEIDAASQVKIKC